MAVERETGLNLGTVQIETEVIETTGKRGLLAGWRTWIYPTIFLTALVIIWEIITRAELVPPYILPAPSAVVERLFSDWSIIWEHTWTTLQEVVAGFFLGSVFGILLALPIAYSSAFRNTIYPIIISSQAVPKIAIAPLLVLWLGFGLWPKIVITALMVFFPVVVTAAEGFSSVDRSLLELLRSVHAPRWQVFSRISFPHALPRIFAGLKIGITLAVVGAIVGEWVGADSGLGYLLVYANTFLDSTLLFSALTLLVVLGVGLFMIVGGVERLVMPWKKHTTAQT
jgi:NitT/TauT family transport system permease protein